MHANVPRFSRLSRAAPAVAALLLAACGHGGAPPQMPAPAVNVAKVVQKEVTRWDEFTGRIEAVDSVEIKPRVTGYLESVEFVEGREVRKGDVLFVIDEREYRAAAQRAEADVGRALARTELADKSLARAQAMLAAKAISKEEFETREAEQKQSMADLRAMQAAAAQARLNLSFTRVTSPIDGRVGKALVTPGNLVTSGAPGATLLTTVVSVDPVYVAFEGDEQTYLRYQQMARDGERPSSRDAANPVRVGLANERGYPHEGRMNFVDNAVDPSTGTIRARAVLDNKDRVFTPGLFARVQLLGSGRFPATLVNDHALVTDQDRKFLWVLGPDNKALRRDVKLGPEIDGLRVVTDGLAAGDSVIVNGVQKVFFPGMPVAPNQVPMDDPEQAPPAEQKVAQR